MSADPRLAPVSRRGAARRRTRVPPTGAPRELAVAFPASARWGLCLTHDIDHLGLREHFVDGYLLRYAARCLRENLVHRFRPVRALDALSAIPRALWGDDRFDNLDALLETERRFDAASTWFVAIRRGLGIAYGPEAAARTVRRLVALGQDVALHGQADDDPDALLEEIGALASLAGRPILGLRMHYLRWTADVRTAAARGRLAYDSTEMDRRLYDPAEHPLAPPYRGHGPLVEIPLHVMDSTLFSSTGFGFDAAEAIAYTAGLIDNARRRGRVIVVNLHPDYYSRQTPDVVAWYDDLLARARDAGDAWITDMRGLLPRLVDP